MIVRTLDQIRHTERDIDTPNWNSLRLLLKADGMGFSLHETCIRAGTTTTMCYKNHLEAVYCVGGEGLLRDLDRGETHIIRDATVYALDKHDRHEVIAKTDMRLVCVFNPPLSGREVHDADGAYPILEDTGS